MPYTDLLRVTVFITGAEATALGAITALAAGRDGDTRTVIVAAVWWAADWPMWWGPEPSVGLLIYAVLGAALVQARFMLSARAGGTDL